MKIHSHSAIWILYLTVAVFCGAAGFAPVPVNRGMLQSSAVTTPDQRIEVPSARTPAVHYTGLAGSLVGTCLEHFHVFAIAKTW